jgi:hypothetical protein
MPYSKSHVNRAGQLFVDHIRAAAAGKRHVGQQRAELTEAIEIIDWWRGEHAKPLSRVAANLRYYAGVEGEPVVAQRLKKLPTIVGKLIRTPGMKLTRMEDLAVSGRSSPVRTPSTAFLGACGRTGRSPGFVTTSLTRRQMATEPCISSTEIAVG